jgi:hypothetical protein
MVSLNKETFTMVAIAVALFAVFYVYRELQSTKLELQKLSAVPVPVAVPHVPQVQQVPQPKPVKKKEPVEETE